MARRIGWLGAAMGICFLALFLQLNNIQVLKAHAYATSPDNPQVRNQKFNQPRGEIQASDGRTILAMSVPTGAPVGQYQYRRVYPQGSLYSQIVGVDSIFSGLTGVEDTYNRYLVTHNQPVKTLGDLLTTRSVTDTVVLTVNPVIQQAARAALNGQDGAIVVLNPSTGAIEAMYSNPTYDPNGLAALDYQTYAENSYLAQVSDAHGFNALTSLAYQDIFFPGSTFKTVTSAAVYDHAPTLVNHPFTSYSCIPPGTFGGQTTYLCNFGSTPGSQGAGCGGTLAEMLPPSCDTGYALVGATVGAQGMYEEATSFGFDQQPPIDLPHSPYEISKFPTPQQVANAQVFLAFSSIGQKFTLASPLQMAMVASAFANKGVIMTPHVMDEITDSTGALVTRYQPTPWLTATSPGTAAAVGGLMYQVVHAPNGTAAGVGFPAIDDVAAKTGTAQTGENNQFTTDWMIAFAPASAPKVAIAVCLPDEPGGFANNDATGAALAGPLMKQMLQVALAQP